MIVYYKPKRENSYLVFLIFLCINILLQTWRLMKFSHFLYEVKLWYCHPVGVAPLVGCSPVHWKIAGRGMHQAADPYFTLSHQCFSSSKNQYKISCGFFVFVFFYSCLSSDWTPSTCQGFFGLCLKILKWVCFLNL